MGNAVSGVGTIFQRWDDDLYDFVRIAEITAINGPGMSRDTIDVTSLSSVGGYREFIASFRNGGTVSLTMNFTRTTYDKMKADFESDLQQFYRFLLPDAASTTCSFYGCVIELPLSIPADDKITSDISIQVSGEVNISSENTAFSYTFPFNL